MSTRLFVKGNGIMLHPAVKILNEHLTSLRNTPPFESLEAEAQHQNTIADIENAIKQIVLCEQYGIHGDAVINKLPETESILQCYKVVHDNGGSDKSQWEEVALDGENILFAPGDCVVRV